MQLCYEKATKIDRERERERERQTDRERKKKATDDCLSLEKYHLR